MAKYIEKQALRDKLYEAEAITLKGVEIINQFPPADVRPVVRGKWIFHDCGEATCPACKTRQKNIWDYYGWQNFCGNCGADLRGEKIADEFIYAEEVIKCRKELE